MVANSNSVARVIIRERDDQSRVREYTPLMSKLKINGKKKPDELSVTLPITGRARIGDTISYVEDAVDLTNLSALWNFQLSCRDERGYDFDPSKRAISKVTCLSVAVSDVVTINGLTYTAISGSKAGDYTKFSQGGTDAQDAVDLADSINNDTRVGTIKNINIMAVTDGSSQVFLYINPIGSVGNDVTITTSNRTRLPVQKIVGNDSTGSSKAFGTGNIRVIKLSGLTSGDLINGIWINVISGSGSMNVRAKCYDEVSSQPTNLLAENTSGNAIYRLGWHFLNFTSNATVPANGIVWIGIETDSSSLILDYSTGTSGQEKSVAHTYGNGANPFGTPVDGTDVWNMKAQIHRSISGNFDLGEDLDLPASRFTEATSGKMQGNYQLDFSSVDEQVYFDLTSGYYKSPTGLIVSEKINLSKMFEIQLWITPDLVPYLSGSGTPVLFSWFDGGKGIEISLQEQGTTGKWYVRVKSGAGFGVGTVVGTSAVVFEEGVSDQTPRHIRVWRDENNKIWFSANGLLDANSGGVTNFDMTPSRPICFGADYQLTNHFSGQFNQVRFYSGNYMGFNNETALVGAKYQPQVMEFGGRIWERKDKTTTKEVKAQSYSKDLNNFKVTLDAITKNKISTVSRGTIGAEDAYYTGDQSPTLDQDGTPTGIYIRNESGVQSIFVAGDSTNAIDEYDLTPSPGGFVDLGSASFSGNTTGSLGSILLRDLAFRNSTNFYILNGTANKVQHYSMSAWDLTTKSASGQEYNYSGTTTTAQGMDINTTHLYICDGSHIYEFTMSTSWNPSTVTGLTNTLNAPSGVTGLVGLRVEINGDYIYAVDGTTKKVYRWSLPTPFSLSGAVLEESFYIGNEISIPQGLDIEVSGGTRFVVLDSSGDSCSRYKMRTAHRFNAANRYSTGEMDEIIKDIVNNIDDSFLVINKATMPSQWTGTFLADGTFSELVNLLLVRGSLTFYTTPRKLLIIEDAVENGTKQKTSHQFYQVDNVTNPDVYRSYKITDSHDNDTILINEITLVGAKQSDGTNIISNVKLDVKGDKPHSLRINVPQISNQTDLDNLRDAILDLNNSVKKSYKVEAPMDIHHVRYNQLVRIHNGMLGIDGAVDGYFKVEAIEQSYPQSGTILYINQFSIDFFELARTETKQVEGLQSESVVPTVIIPLT